MKKVLILCLSLVFSVTLAMAQLSVKGVVLDDSGEPVIGASVIVEGTTTGTITNMNGQFSIGTVPSGGKKIRVSYVGMISQMLDIKSNMSIILKSDTKTLDEVVVVAYGTTSSRNLTGAISSYPVFTTDYYSIFYR